MNHVSLPGRSAPHSLSTVERHRCAACGASGGVPLVDLHDVPSNSCLMLPTEAAARAWPRGDISLMLCEACGFIANRAFEPYLTEYSERYEPSQSWSPAFRRYHGALAERLASALPLAGRHIVEIGCGQGEFLHLLCGLSGATGLGFDPCVDDRRSDVVQRRATGVRLIADFFDAQAAKSLEADLLVCKMTLEHIPAAGHFAALCAQVARNSRPGMHIFVQVPDSQRILRDIAFEDIYYEHCCYFTEVSLCTLFARHGFVTQAVWRDYDGQYIGILARHADVPHLCEPTASVVALRQMAAGFALRHAERIEHWRRCLETSGSVVVWGSGSKGVTFLGAVAARTVTHVVDINPHRQGMHMVGTGHPIVAPDALRIIRPDTVVVMNRVYRDEVGSVLSGLGMTLRLRTL